MKRIRQVLVYGACVAALIDGGGCSSDNGLGSSEEVQAAGQSHDLFFFQKFHHKKKRKHHWDDCGDDAGVSEDAGTRMCQNLALNVDSLKHRKATQKADGTINVRVPETLSAYFWGKGLQAQLTLQSGDKRVVCSYSAPRRHAFGGLTSSLELDSCDNGAKAGDSVAIDSATLELLNCARLLPISKVWVELPEIEPCGGMPTMPQCDPSSVDDHNSCTRDFCGSDGTVQHEPVPSGTSCADEDVCNGTETCDGQGACKNGDAPTPPQPNACQTRMCDPTTGWTLVPKPAGTSCADANVCNGEERCTTNGMCGDGMALDTDDNNKCTTDACDPMRGVTHVPVDTDDDSMCTTDSCDPATGVVHTPTTTEDNNMCTTDACDPMNGVTHVPVHIDDGEDCTLDACVPLTGVTHIDMPDFVPCAGGTKTCIGGKCVMLN